MLTHLPESIGDLANLEVLNLADNKIVEIPTRFGCLDKLLKLNLDGNQLTVIPSCMGNLRTLSDLSIAKNFVQCFGIEATRCISIWCGKINAASQFLSQSRLSRC